MQHTIVSVPDKKFIGMRLTMSLAEDRTRELWQSFMPQRRYINGQIGTDLYSIELYPDGYFEHFDPKTVFDKWAAVEVESDTTMPAGMHQLIVPAGEYAVFIHRGTAAELPRTYGYIFGEWLPSSGFALADRPHLAVMDDKYKNDDPTSEEEIWIPVRARSA